MLPARPGADGGCAPARWYRCGNTGSGGLLEKSDSNAFKRNEKKRRPRDPRAVRAPTRGFDSEPAAEPSAPERRRIEQLLGAAPVPVDELIRQAGLPPAMVQLVLLELELGGRLERHAGGRVSLR